MKVFVDDHLVDLSTQVLGTAKEIPSAIPVVTEETPATVFTDQVVDV